MSDKLKEGGNPYYIPTLRGRLDMLCNLSLFPVAICFLAFTRPVFYRISGGAIGGTFKDVLHKQEDVHLGKPCPKFGWLNNAQFTVTCDNRSLDIHAILAVFWLVLFTVQILFIKYRFAAFHRKIGRFGMPIVFFNAYGMMQFAAYDFFYPMEDTPRPAIFTPFMWLLSVEMIKYLKASKEALETHDIDGHALWMYRAFVKSFSTPVMRFYPMVLRYLFGTTCADLNKGKSVFASMTIAGFFICLLSYLANIFCMKDPMDKFLKGTLVKTAVTFLVEFVMAYFQGSFIYGMYHCWKVGPDNFDTAFAWRYTDPMRGEL